MHKIVLFLNVFSEIAFHQITHGAFCQTGIDNFLNGSALLNKMAAMPIYDKNT